MPLGLPVHSWKCRWSYALRAWTTVVIWGVAIQVATADPAKFLSRHCLECHDTLTAKSGLDLETLSPEMNDRATFDRWVQVHDLVRDGEMPPAKRDRPDAAEQAVFLRDLSERLVLADRKRIEREGRALVRRLNRHEYENSLRQLLRIPGLRVTDRLPEDGTLHLFSKSGECLDVSHVQMAKYLEVAGHALRLALNAAAHPPTTNRFHAREEPVFQHYMKWRPGLQTSATRSVVPLLDLTPQTNVIRGLEPMSVGTADPETREREAMGVFSGTYAATTKYDFTRMRIPIDGQYRVRLKTYTFRAGTNGASGGNDHGLTGGHRLWWRPDRNVAKRGNRSEPVTLYALRESGDTRWLTTFDSHPDPTVVERSVFLTRGEMIRPDATRLVRTRPGWKGNPNATPEGIPGLAFQWLEVEGPISQAWPLESYQALFGDLPFEIQSGRVRVQSGDPEKDANRLLASFARRAFRGRAPSEAALERFTGIYRAARNLVDSDFTFVNERLAGHYGLESPARVGLERVSLPMDSPRGGLLTQASVLKVTANGTTTSPVLRGVWLVERILGVDIPPPPSGVEAIEPDTRGATTIREQLDRHSGVASCAACHRKFDPLGFALESFDVLGGWRDRYRAMGEQGDPVEGLGKNGHAFTFRLALPVDSAEELQDGRPFSDIHGIKPLLLQDEGAIARNLLNQLTVYATGAPVGFADRREVERMLEACAPEFRVRDLIHALVQSRMFRGK